MDEKWVAGNQSKLAFKNFSNSFLLFSAALSSFVLSSFNRIYKNEQIYSMPVPSLVTPQGLAIINKLRNPTFLPETALRRTPSSLSRPKNCMNQNGIMQLHKKDTDKNKNKKYGITNDQSAVETFESCTGLPLLSSCCFYICLPLQVNQESSQHVTDPSSNFREPIHKTGRKYYKHLRY